MCLPIPVTERRGKTRMLCKRNMKYEKMISMKVTRILGLWIVSALCFFSCTEEEQGPGNIIPDVSTTPVRLALGMTPMHETGGVTRARGDNSLDLVLGEESDRAGTRAGTLTDDQENAVGDICVFQFGNGDSKLKYSEYATLTDGQLTADISLASGMGTCTVYVLANVGDLTSRVAYGSSLADFKKLAAEVTSGKGTGQNLPMCGSKNDFNSETANASLTVQLTRSVAKVSLNLTTPNSGDAFAVSAIKLMNVAKKLYYVESAATAPSAPTELTDYTSNNSNTITWYIPENKAGTNSLTDWKDRYEGNVPATATYILIEGSYTPKGGTARDVSYAIYLGAGNNPADFNVVRNTKYTVNATIKGTNLNDGRVLVGKDLSAAGTRTVNCYVVKTTDANKWYRFKATVRGNGAQTAAQISYTGAEIPAGAEISPVKAGLVWETRDSNGTVHTLDYVGYSRNGYIVFKLGSALEGNAVVAAKDGASKILWSWHIWATAAFDGNSIKVQTYETRPRTVSGHFKPARRTGIKMMDRNLGAASGTASKVAAEVIKTYGLYFQFGRKDPFPAAGVMTRADNAEIVPVYDGSGNQILKNSNQPKNSTITRGIDQPAVAAQLAYTVENPLVFILTDSGDKANSYGGDNTNASYNWIFAAHPQTVPWKASNKLWGGGLTNEVNSLILGTVVDIEKTIYDPCPYGYHMPPQDIWTNFTTAPSAYNTSNLNSYYNGIAADRFRQTNTSIGFTDAGFAVWGRRVFTTGTAEATVDGESNVAFYPAAGYRDGLNGLVSYVGLGCLGWSASPYSADSPYSSILRMDGDWVGTVTTPTRADGFPVRCVRD